MCMDNFFVAGHKYFYSPFVVSLSEGVLRTLHRFVILFTKTRSLELAANS